MAATSVQLAPTNDTDANFRLWGKAISDQMAAGGWVKTADSGQIDWATVLKPAASNTVQGYEIWRSNDAAGSIVQMYAKLEYGSNVSNAAHPQVWLTIGWGSNGSGTLTGQLSTRTALQPSSSNSATLYWSNLSVGSGFISICMWSGWSNGIFFSVERERDSAGNQLNSILILSYGQTSVRTQVVTQTITYTQMTDVNYGQALVNPSQVIQGSKAGLSLQFGQKGGLTSPSKNVFGGSIATMGLAQTNDLKITTFGIESNYIVNAIGPYFAFNKDNNIACLSRFE